MQNMKKILVLALAALLLVAVSVAGTVAYLTAKTDPVTNTFTTAELGVVLSETKTSDDKWEQPLLPGETYDKDPKVALTDGSVDAWVFVEIVETNNTLTSDNSQKKVTCNIDTDNWVQVMDDNDNAVKTDKKDSVGIWMYKTSALTASASGVYFLEGGTNGSVTVNPDVTSEDMKSLPTITFYAYALQSDNLKIGDDVINSTLAADAAYKMWQLVAPTLTTTAP